MPVHSEVCLCLEEQWHNPPHTFSLSLLKRAFSGKISLTGLISCCPVSSTLSHSVTSPCLIFSSPLKSSWSHFISLIILKFITTYASSEQRLCLCYSQLYPLNLELCPTQKCSVNIMGYEMNQLTSQCYLKWSWGLSWVWARSWGWQIRSFQTDVQTQSPIWIRVCWVRNSFREAFGFQLMIPPWCLASSFPTMSSPSISKAASPSFPWWERSNTLGEYLIPISRKDTFGVE